MDFAIDGRSGVAVLERDGGEPLCAGDVAAAQGACEQLVLRRELMRDGCSAERDGDHFDVSLARQAAIERGLHAGLRDEERERAVISGAHRT